MLTTFSSIEIVFCGGALPQSLWWSLKWLLSEAGKEEVTVSLENLQSNTDDILISKTTWCYCCHWYIQLLEYAIPTQSFCHRSWKRKELPELRRWQNHQIFKSFPDWPRYMRVSHGLGARWALRTKSRGPKGLQLEVGARRPLDFWYRSLILRDSAFHRSKAE